MKTKNLTRQNGSIKLRGWLHSNKENGKFTKVQTRFIKLEENGKFFYFGKKRFIKPFFIALNKGLKTMTSFCNLRQENPIIEQVLLFAGTLFPHKKPNEKIIVSRQDFKKIVKCKDNYGYSVVDWNCGYSVLGFKLEKEKINNFPRAKFGEKRTNKNFELRK